VFERDVGHLREVAVEQIGEVLRFELVGRLGEVTTSEKKMVSFLRLEAISTFCAPVKIEW
jgi:hypothetical protein